MEVRPWTNRRFGSWSAVEGTMANTDFRAIIHELMVADLSIPSFMSEVVSAHESAHPQYDWEPLKRLDFNESDELLQKWLAPAFKREPPRAKRIRAIWCGLFQPIRDGEPVADMYVAGTKNFEMNAVPSEWN